MPERARGHVDFWWFYGLLSFVLSTLAIVRLAQYAIDTGTLSAPLQAVVNAYEQGIHLALGWTEPYLGAALQWLGAFFNWDVTLHSHWRHIFVLSALLWSPALRIGWKEASSEVNWFVLLLFGLTWIFSSLAGACAAGALPLDSNNLITQGLIAALPLTVPALATLFPLVFLGAYAESEGEWGIWNGLKVVLGLVIGLFLFCLVLAWGVSRFPLPGVPHSGLGAFGMLTVLAALGCILSGVGMSLENWDNKDHQAGSTWLETFMGHPATRIGMMIFGSFGSAALFFAADAGLKLASR